jgi:CubicO group peptidase (beta-lactamase class C family)
MISRRTFGIVATAALVAPAARATEPELPPQAPGDGTSPALTPQRLDALRAAAGMPALAAAAARRGGQARLWATGLRMRGAQAPATTEDQWHLGSIGKSFLATLVARLVDHRRLAWNDTLSAALDADFPALPAPYRDATFRHLLSHRAGLIGNLPVQMYALDMSGADERTQRRRLLAEAFAQAPVAPLGAMTFYSNLGYVAAAAMIEARTGEAWQTLMRREVFGPLGLKSAGFGPPGLKGRVDQPVGHGLEQPPRPHPPGGPNDDFPLVIGPAGRIHMSLGDLVTYLAAHRDRTRLLKPAGWDELHTPHFDGEYALGWNTWPDGTFTHDGSNLLWYAVASFNPKTGIVAAAATNDGRPSVGNAVGEALREAKGAV